MAYTACLEDYLTIDDMLVDYFNEFLSLPTFVQPVKFNSDLGVFEVVNDAPQHLESQLKKILHDQKPPNPIYDVIRKAKNDEQLSKKSSTSPAFNIDPNYNTMRLHREQAIQWIKKERLPAFLESDCYFEYRLAKLISQVEWSKTGINFIIDRNYYPWIMKTDPSPPFPEEDATSSTMKKFYVSLGKAMLSQTEDWFTLAKQSESMKNADSFTHPLASHQIQDVQCLPGQHERDDLLSEKSGLLEAGSLSKESHQRRCISPSRTASAKARKRSRKAEEDSSVAIAEHPSHTQLRVYLDQKWESAGKGENGQESGTFQTLEEFISAYVQFILKEAISNLTGQPAAESESDVDFNKWPKVFIHELANNEVSLGTTEPLFSQSFSSFTVLDSKGDVPEHDTEEVSLRLSSESEGADSRAAWCISHRTYDIGNRREFERFKKFIKGTLGERYWWLWMDIERLKVLKDTRRQQRHLDKMKKLYLLSGGDYCLSSEVLLRLDLLRGDQWNIRHLRQIQPEVVKPLLLYWGPRFCVTHSTAIQTACTKLKLWHTQQERPRVDIDPFPQMVSLLPLRPKSCLPRITHFPPHVSRKSRASSPTTLLKLATPDFSLKRSSRLSATLSPSQSPRRNDDSSSRKWPKSVNSGMIHCLALDDTEDSKYQGGRKYTYAELLQGKSAAGSAVLGGSRMESMLQSLYLENRAGHYFTHFCEKSGNKLWENSVYFWFDLQAYHQLFYQETLHPFKICKQAQFLYANYIAPSASMDIGLRQNKKYEIYKKIDPAFEDLFDPAEEHILTLLLEPWMKMAEADKCTYEKVELVEETRQLDSVYFRKLQALHQESVSKKDESAAADTGLPTCPDVLPKDQDLCQVPQELAGPNLCDLIHDKLKLEQFRVFLDERSAGTDLMCWLDIEQFRRMLHKDKEKREEKSKDIKNKYLNKKYFFGPNSPATREQQEELMRSGGGWGQILHDQVSPAILLEIQKYVQKRLEKQWLPLFLADEQHGADEKAKIRDIVEDLLIQKKEKTTRMWKHVDNKWVSSSREIIAFRKALLNPVTANQFQRFVSLKGDLLANGVLFWQEVQKYKDLCHSHCDNATIQNKITAIINCFINSTVPPALQIDIPIEQAEKILEHRKELGPYIFREAQMTIFALLFKFWQNFCEFRSNLASDKILPALERKKEKQVQKKKGKTAEVRLTEVQGKGEGKKALSLSSSVFGDKFGVEGRRASSPYGYVQQVSWSYSKYIEALEQERILLKMQEDLEKNSSSLLTGSSSVSLLKACSSEKFILSPRSSTILEKHSDLPRETESRLKFP
ncbi:regulator of G-protein signaling 22 [Apteryx mantelli]|uniref:Regulator of G-protein signaling 22 n=1 Tax=Apteryx mantelli TaxID=2696672 RepID=A0ABM4E045_9AVES